MDKSTSQILKGFAILLMIYLHLFNRMENVELCQNVIFIRDFPLSFILSRATNPVAFFLILGGYGLFKVWQKGDKNRWWRVARLFIHYWIILFVFLFIGHFIDPKFYPGSFIKFICNFTSYDTTYNEEMWFLAPYVIISLLSPFFFKLLKNIRWTWIVGVTFAIHIIMAICFREWGHAFIYKNDWLYIPMSVLFFSLNFFLGYVAARDGFFSKLSQRYKSIPFKYKSLVLFFILCVLVTIQMWFKHNYFYAFFCISILSLFSYSKLIKKVLTQLGNQSMNMWMIHTWYCYYLFHDFFYSLKYPLLIFIVTVVISYLSSFVINFLAAPIEKLILTKREMRQKPIL